MDVEPIRAMVRERGDEAVLELTRRFDATEGGLEALARRPRGGRRSRWIEIDAPLREALETAADNIRVVAEAQLSLEPAPVDLPQGHRVEVHDVPVGAAGIYAPGGRAAYPSSVLMCGIPARVAEVPRVALASPPAPDGEVNRVVLAAAALAGIEEIYAMGGAQAVFAFAYGTETIQPVDVIAGPGNDWVTEAKRARLRHRRDRLARRALGADGDRRPRGRRRRRRARPLRPGRARGGEPADPRRGRGGHRRGDHRGRRAHRGRAALASPTRRSPLLQVPDTSDALALANAYAPEHLEILTEDAAELAGYVTTAGCVFIGPLGATAFGDYNAGSNHVLPTGGTGRFTGPLGPGTFRRRMSHVHMTEQAAAALAPNVDVIARAEGLPVHGESAVARTQQSSG